MPNASWIVPKALVTLIAVLPSYSDDICERFRRQAVRGLAPEQNFVKVLAQEAGWAAVGDAPFGCLVSGWLLGGCRVTTCQTRTSEVA